MCRDTDYGNFRDFDMCSMFDGISDECERDVSARYEEMFDEFCEDMANKWYDTEDWTDGDWDDWRDIVEQLR